MFQIFYKFKSMDDYEISVLYDSHVELFCHGTFVPVASGNQGPISI